METPLVPISWGELIDKITILEIKADRIRDSEALANIHRELTLLRKAAVPAWSLADIRAFEAQLGSVNRILWDIEDRIRAKETSGQFDDEFIALARAVYTRNDERSALKRAINAQLGSEIVEEKSYGPRRRRPL
jgi:hypothetical protein